MTIPLERPEGTRTTLPPEGGAPTEPVRPETEAAAKLQQAHTEAGRKVREFEAVILAAQIGRDEQLKRMVRLEQGLRAIGHSLTLPSAGEEEE
jgi:hypothetical protein